MTRARTASPFPPVLRAVVAALALGGGAMAQDQVPGEGADDELSVLRKRVEELERRLDADERSALAPDPDAIVREATHTTPEGFAPLPGTAFVWKLGGYVKVDVIHDLYEIGNEDKFSTQTISVPEDRESRSNIHAKETRLNVDLRGPFGPHEGRIFVETDFFNSSESLHMRHALGQVGGLLVGQTWTTYMDLSSRPHTLDFEGPDSEIFERSPMVRWTQDVGERTTFSVAIEDMDHDMTVDPSLTGSSETPLPDLTGNLRHEADGWHVQGSGVVRYLHFEGSQGASDDSTLGWGVALSGKKQLGDPGRRLMGQVSLGEGNGSYSQALRGTGSDAVVTAGGSLRPVRARTLVTGYEHDWTDEWSSTFAYSIADVHNTSTQAATAVRQLQSASANLTWRPFDNFLTGAEYLYGTREDKNGQDGVAHRLQFSFKFLF